MSDTMNPTAGAATNGTVPAGQMQQQASTTDTGANPATTSPAQAPATGEAAQATTRTYTHDDYQRMSTSQYAAGIVSTMKAAGFNVDRSKPFNEQIEAFRMHLQGSSDDLAKQATEAVRAEEQAKVQSLERKISALSKGIPESKLDRYVRLAETYISDDVDFSAALDSALDEFPLSKGEGIPRIVAPAQKSTTTKQAYQPPKVL